MHLRALIAGPLVAGAAARHIPRDLTIRQNTNTSSSTIELRANVYGLRYEAPTTIGDETFNLLIDTGSSDVFVIEEDFQCHAPSAWSNDLIEIPQALCGYADEAYEIYDSDSFERISNESFQVSYAAGMARGHMAFEDITLGDITVTDQRFGLVNWSTPMNFDGSGVLGLAYPIMTSAYNGSIDPDSLTPSGTQQPYSPLFVSMFRRGLVDPYFSLALERLDPDQESGDGGYMVLGGLPPVNTQGPWTTVPAEFYEAADLRSRNGTRVRSYWATTVDSITYGSSNTWDSSYQAIVDTGAPLTSVPRSVAEEFNSLFDPPATWNEIQQAYAVDCDSSAPAFSFRVGGTTFDLDPADLILHTGQESRGEDLCLSAITPGIEIQRDPNDASNTTELYILGVSFLRPVVSVFDFGESEMRFAKRESAAVRVNSHGWMVFAVVAVVVQVIL
ncbi:aspartic peptidase domain-containing protein [Aspergillus egyptiacus]|nr:aspartic peptidase domain-containing protein [Aspergillus egyptiacus]